MTKPIPILSEDNDMPHHHPSHSSPNVLERAIFSWPSRWRQMWDRNIYVLLAASAQLFAALMNLSAGLLERDGDGMHPLQIIFARMSLTTILSCIYMYWKQVPGFPSGPPEIRILLLVRGFCGFIGIYGMWYSMIYLRLAEATVLTFLVPSLSGYICYFLLKDPFTVREQIASYIALAGVVLIARPTSFFSSSESPETAIPRASVTSDAAHGDPQGSVTAIQRLIGVGMAIVGVIGTAGAFITIRHIGQKAHPLILVNYYSALCTVMTSVVLGLAPIVDIWQPYIRFALPQTPYQWFLFFSLGVCGFTMQFLLTAGLSGEKSNRAIIMLYTEIIYAVAFDKWIFGNKMKLLSVAGCILIVGSALWGALTRSSEQSCPVPQIDLELASISSESSAEGSPRISDT